MEAGTVVALVLSSTVVATAVGKIIDAIVDVKKEKRQENKEENAEFELVKSGLKSILASDIERRCDKYIAKGELTARDKERLQADWELYHNGLGGNGYLDMHMSAVDELKVNL